MKSDSLQRFSEYLQKLCVTVPYMHLSVIITQCSCLFRLLKICSFFNFKIVTDEDMRHIETSISNKNISIVIYFKSWLPFGKSHLFHFTKSVVFPWRNFSFNSFTLRSALKVQCKQSDSKNHHDELQINSWFYILPKNEVVYVVDPFILSVKYCSDERLRLVFTSEGVRVIGGVVRALMT